MSFFAIWTKYINFANREGGIRYKTLRKCIKWYSNPGTSLRCEVSIYGSARMGIYISVILEGKKKKNKKKQKKKQKTNPDFEDCKKVNKKSFVSAIVPHTH